MALSQEQVLKRTLEKLFDEMLTKGILPEGAAGKKENIIANIMDTFKENDINLSRENFLDRKVQRALCMAILSEVVAAKELENNPNKKPELKFDYTKLFLEKNPNDLKKELTDEITKLLTALNQLRPEYPTPNIKKEAEEIADKLVKDFEPFKKQAENKKSLDVFEELLGAAFFQLHNKSLNGKIPTVVSVSNIIGNLNNYVNNEQPSETSFMGKEQKKEYEDLSHDVENKITTIIEDLAQGIDNQEVERLLNPSPFEMKPHPKGTIQSG